MRNIAFQVRDHIRSSQRALNRDATPPPYVGSVESDHTPEGWLPANLRNRLEGSNQILLDARRMRVQRRSAQLEALRDLEDSLPRKP